MEDLVKKIDKFFKKELWQLETASFGAFKSILIKSLKIASFTVREIYSNELTLRAMSLVYTTLLSIVPLLALSFSILKAFGVVNKQLEPLLLRFLNPLGPKGSEITQKIMEFINNTNVGVLGAIGLLILIWTVFSMIKKIDDSLNIIWNVKKGRSLIRRFSNYISITLIGPVLLFAIIGLTASLASNTIVQKLSTIEPFGTLIVIWGHIVPYIIVSIVFIFIYIVVPNTKVNFRSALLGGVIAGILWQSVGTVFTYTVASSSKYFLIYSGLAILILFMIWLYISWLILLLGAQISYCHQNFEYFGKKIDISALGTKLREKLVLLIMYLIGHNYHHGKKALTINEIVELSELPYDAVTNSIRELETKKLLTESSDEPPRYLPGKSLESIKLKEIVDSTRINEQSDMLLKRNAREFSKVDNVMDKIDSSFYESLGETTLRDIIE